MQFIRAEAVRGTEKLTSQLSQLLDKKPVLWLASGGSNVPIATAVIASLAEGLTERLTIMLIDERFGPAGHDNSNADQLHRAGFNPKRANFITILSDQTWPDTVTQYNKIVQQQFNQHSLIIGQFGIGADGHTAGILPHSPAASVTDQLVTGYQGPDYQRITLTFPALRQIQTAYVFAYGANKLATLQQLKDQNLDLGTQPAQIFKVLTQAYIYNDQLEGET
jgi:6-phosphogluconolactonase/glucosamine-6-phosphate isomerase/deaminase